MKSIKIQISYIFLCMILSFLIAPQLGAQQDVPPEVIQAAEEGLSHYMAMLSRQDEEYQNDIIGFEKNDPLDGIGFEKNDPFDQAYLGESFRLHGIKLDSISNYQENAPVNSILPQRNEWYFLVMIGEQAKSILIVAKTGDTFRAVGIGGMETATELDKINKQWSKGEGYTPLLVKSYRLDNYAFTVPQSSVSNLTIMGKDKDYSKLENSYDVIKELQSKIEGLQD